MKKLYLATLDCYVGCCVSLLGFYETQEEFEKKKEYLMEGTFNNNSKMSLPNWLHDSDNTFELCDRDALEISDLDSFEYKILYFGW